MTAPLAPLKKRIIGGIIDFILAVVLSIALSLLLASVFDFAFFDDVEGITDAAASVMQMVFYAVYLLIVSFLEHKTGKTPGKMVMDTKVLLMESQTLPTFKKAFLRNLLRGADYMLFGIVGIIFVASTKNNQRLGDIVAGTVVVCDDKPAA